MTNISWSENGRNKIGSKYSEVVLPIDLYEFAKTEGYVVPFTDTRYVAAVGRFGVGLLPKPELRECLNLSLMQENALRYR